MLRITHFRNILLSLFLFYYSGTLIGFPSGIGVTYILVKALASEYEMKLIFGWMTFVIPIILVFGVSLFVSWLVSKKNKKINMVEALKVPE